MTKKRTDAAFKMRLKLRAERERQFQEDKEERLLARWLLFCKGRGQIKNLPQKEKQFIQMVEHKAYDRYMSDLILGTKTRLGQGKDHALKLCRWTPSHPCPFTKYCYYWRSSAKRNYLRWDVPRLMKMRWEMLKNGSTDTEMQERGGRYMQELQRQISERERRDVDIPVSVVPVHSGSVEGRNQGQKQLRERRKKTPAGNRDAAAVGA